MQQPEQPTLRMPLPLQVPALPKQLLPPLLQMLLCCLKDAQPTSASWSALPGKLTEPWRRRAPTSPEHHSGRVRLHFFVPPSRLSTVITAAGPVAGVQSTIVAVACFAAGRRSSLSMHSPRPAPWRSQPPPTLPQPIAGVDGKVRRDRGVFGQSWFSCFCGGVAEGCSSTVRGPIGVGSRTRRGGCGTELVPEHAVAAPTASQPWLLATGAATEAGVGVLQAASGCNFPGVAADDSALATPEGGSHNPVPQGFAEGVMAAAAEARRARTCTEELCGIVRGVANRNDDVCKPGVIGIAL